MGTFIKVVMVGLAGLILFVFAAAIVTDPRPARPPRPTAKQMELLEAAAALAGATSGMAATCRLDHGDVVSELKRLLDRFDLDEGQRARLTRTATTATGTMAGLNPRPSASDCAAAQQDVAQGLSTLRSLSRP